MKNRNFIFVSGTLIFFMVFALTLMNSQTALADNNGKIAHIELHGVPIGAYTVVQWYDSYGVWHDVEGWRTKATSDSVKWSVEEKDFTHGPFRWLVYYNDGTIIGESSAFMLPHREHDVKSLDLQITRGGHYQADVHSGYYGPKTPDHGYQHATDYSFKHTSDYGYQYHAPKGDPYGHPMSSHSYPHGEVRVIKVHQTYYPPSRGHSSCAYPHTALSGYDYKTTHYQHGYYQPQYQHGYYKPQYQHGYHQPQYQQGYHQSAGYGHATNPHYVPTYKAYSHHR